MEKTTRLLAGPPATPGCPHGRRSGRNDLSHTRTTSEWVHRLIPHSVMLDPPWDDDEWNYRSISAPAGKEKGLFESRPKLAPQILKFING